ncbi:AfsR/SARP family transcriptional regulator [Streptomyces sp. bgisy100]|uniref:AfsR/SARP family transcriptional regulator n=1 Tax=Streptomyces sp. bgisy100 TaxID=3413783 RepID=UPI003D7073FD
MDIGILGPLAVRSTGGEAAPTAPKPRQLLALLAARAGQVVPVDHLVDELWESGPPASAVTTVQTYIVLLRRSLARALQISAAEVARDVLPFTGWGYRLAADPGAVDASVFGRFAELGRRALLNGENDKASLMLRRALRIWRGPVLADVRVGPQLLAHRISLEENRLSVVEQRVESDLRLGKHHELIGELSGLVVQYPLHENLYSLFIISLYRAGRPAQALEAFRILRKNLREELGIDPSSRVRGLQQAILRSDPSLESKSSSGLFLLELGPSGHVA